MRSGFVRRWFWWIAFALILVWLSFPRAEAADVTVSWTPATSFTDGSPLPAGRSWTLVEQYPVACASLGAEAPLDGVGRLISSLITTAAFVQPAGSCYCYVARTVVWSDPVTSAATSAPVPVEKCVPAAGCSGCHA